MTRQYRFCRQKIQTWFDTSGEQLHFAVAGSFFTASSQFSIILSFLVFWSLMVHSLILPDISAWVVLILIMKIKQKSNAIIFKG